MPDNLAALVEAANSAQPIPDSNQAAAAAAAVAAAAEQVATAADESLATMAVEQPVAVMEPNTEVGEVGAGMGVEVVEVPANLDAIPLASVATNEPMTVENVVDSTVADHEPLPVTTVAMKPEDEAAAAAAVQEAVAAAGAAVAAMEEANANANNAHVNVPPSIPMPPVTATVASVSINPDPVQGVVADAASVGVGVDIQMVQNDVKNELTKNIPGARIVERRRKGWVKKTWEERLEELKAYKRVHGDANVPTLSKENPSLGHWVHDQRKQYRLHNEKKQTAMTPHRIEKLEEVGFKWALQRHTTMKSWNERFEELKNYKADKGNCNVPIRYKGNPSLGQWVSTQRQEYGAKKKGTKTNITDERIKALEEVGFVWSLRDTSKMAPRKSWDAHYASLIEFKEKNGHCDVRVRSKQHPTGSLGRWVEKQRHHYNSREDGKDSKITNEQIQKLEDLGFKWRVRNEKRSIVEKRMAAAKAKELEAKIQAEEEHEAQTQEETAAAIANEVAAGVEQAQQGLVGVGVETSAAVVDAGVVDNLPMPVVDAAVTAEAVDAGAAAVAAEASVSVDVNMEVVPESVPVPVPVPVAAPVPITQVHNPDHEPIPVNHVNPVNPIQDVPTPVEMNVSENMNIDSSVPNEEDVHIPEATVGVEI